MIFLYVRLSEWDRKFGNILTGTKCGKKFVCRKSRIYLLSRNDDIEFKGER